MGIIPLAVDEVSGTIIIAATPNNRVFTIQPHPEIDIIDPSNVMAEIASVAHYLTPAYGIDESIADNYKIQDHEGKPYIKYNSGLPFYVGVINALLEDIVRDMELQEKSMMRAKKIPTYADRQQEIEESTGIPFTLEPTDKHVTGVITCFMSLMVPNETDVEVWVQKNQDSLSQLFALLKCGGFDRINDPKGIIMKQSYRHYSNFSRYQSLDAAGKVRAGNLSFHFNGDMETLSQQIGMTDLEAFIRNHSVFLGKNNLLGDVYAFQEINASGKMLATLEDHFITENGSPFLFYGNAEYISVNLHEVLVSTQCPETFVMMFRLFLDTLDYDRLK